MNLRHFHRHTAFPFVVAGLTLTLLVFVAFIVRPRPVLPNASVVSPSEETSVPAMTDAEYEQAASGVMERFDAAYAAAANDVVRLYAVEDAIDGLLALRVTAARRDAHFELVSALYALRDALSAGESATTVAAADLDAVRAGQAWLP